MKLNRKRALGIGLLLLLPLCWIACEVFHARGNQPVGLATLADFHARFGPLAEVRELFRDGERYHELSGRLPRLPWILAFPSSPPAYIFDASGRFVDWSADPGDDPEYRRRWP